MDEVNHTVNNKVKTESIKRISPINLSSRREEFHWAKDYKYFRQHKLKSQISDWSKKGSASKLTNLISGNEI